MSSEVNPPEAPPEKNSSGSHDQLASTFRKEPGCAIGIIVSLSASLLVLLLMLFFTLRDGNDGVEVISTPPTDDSIVSTATISEPSEIVLNPDEYFVPNQIILAVPSALTLRTGIIDEDLGVPTWLSPTITLTIKLSPDGSIPISGTPPPPGEPPFIGQEFCPGLPSNLELSSEFAITLYEITDGRSVEEALEEINDPDGVYSHLIADANLIIGSPDFPTGSTSTWETVAVENQNDYSTQWAFELIERGTPTAQDGDDVRVVILDTVPSFILPENAPVRAEDAALTPTPYEVYWVDEQAAPMQLQVSDGSFSLATPSSSGIEPAPTTDLGHHGLFAAQMVHAVAPGSQIELYRVLDNQVKGNLYSLIETFYDTVLNTENKLPTVVNMSLGIRIPPPSANFQLPEGVGTVQIPAGIETLHTLIQLAYCRGIVVVAAAGNNSINSYPPELAHLPADWSSVIGVAASNMANQRSCFSNQGDIAAPGGDGRMPDDAVPGDPPPLGCRARLDICPLMGGRCPFAVIGPIAPPATGTLTAGANTTGLIYWDGSSFASPLVAGLAARVLSESPDLSPDEVRHIIECGATEATFPDGIEGQPDRHIGEGVINVARTLNECIPPASPPATSTPTPTDE